MEQHTIKLSRPPGAGEYLPAITWCLMRVQYLTTGSLNPQCGSINNLKKPSNSYLPPHTHRSKALEILPESI